MMLKWAQVKTRPVLEVVPGHTGMNPLLAAEVRTLADLGWSVRSQTATSAALETRRSFNWWLVYSGLLMLLGAGAVVYAISWLLTSRVHVFIHAEESGTLRTSGDTQFLARQRLETQRRDGDCVVEPSGVRRPPVQQVFVALLVLAAAVLMNAGICVLMVLGLVSVLL